MEKKTSVMTIIGSFVIALLLLAAGVMIGRTFRETKTVVINPGGQQSTSSDVVTQTQNTITVEGQNKMEVKPEVALISLGIEGCTYGAGKANQLVNERLDSLYTGLIQIGLKKSDIVATDFSLYPEYSSYGTLSSDKASFCATNRVEVTTKQLDMVSKILDTAIASGATNVYGVSYTTQNLDEATQEGIQLAYQDAESQAKTMAKLMNASLLSPISSEVSLDGYFMNSYYGYGGGGGAVDPQTNTLTVKVKVVYGILQ